MRKKTIDSPLKKNQTEFNEKVQVPEKYTDKKIEQAVAVLEPKQQNTKLKKQQPKIEINSNDSINTNTNGNGSNNVSTKLISDSKSSDDTKGYQNSDNSKKNNTVSNVVNKATDVAKKYSKEYINELEKNDDGVKVASKQAKFYIKQDKQAATFTYKLVRDRTKKYVQKREYKKLQKDLGIDPTKKEIKNHLKETFKKPKVKRLKTASSNVLKTGTLKAGKTVESSLNSEDDGIKVALKESKVIAKYSSKMIKESTKLAVNKIKTKKANSKLSKSNIKKMDKEKIQKLKKKKINKKRIYAPQYKKKFLEKSVVNRVTNFFKNFTKLSFKNAIQKIMTTKIMAALFGSAGGIAIVVLIVAALMLVIVGVAGGISNEQTEENVEVGASKNLSPEVERWRSLVEKEANRQGMGSYVNLILAIIQVETGGKGSRDIMQSSESAGLPMNTFQTEEESVKQGVKHLKNIVNTLKGYKKGYESNTKLLAQSYNFGVAFASYVGNRGGEYTLQMAEDYSKTVVAPSLGNTNGATVPYVNPTSIRLGKTYRYVNGGNFLYGEMVGEYLGAAGGNGNYILPVDNPNITSPYGSRTDPITGASGAFHRGLDFGNPMGTPIKAIADGKVITANMHYSWGNHVVILHSDGKLSLYAHQSQMLVKAGDEVKQGQVIGKIGSTGDSTGPHLHLEIAKSNSLAESNLLDPAIVLGIK